MQASDAPSIGAVAEERVLLGGFTPQKAGRLAHGFATRGLAATLTFDAAGALALMDRDRFALVALHHRLVDEDEALLSAIRRGGSAVLVLDAPDGSFADRFGGTPCAEMPGDATVHDVVVAGAALLSATTRWRAGIRTWGPFELDLGRRRANDGGRPIALTKLQFRILEMLVSAQGTVVSKNDLDRFVYGEPSVDGGERTVAHIRRIRTLIEPDPKKPRRLLTVRGEGFRLTDWAPEIDGNGDCAPLSWRAEQRDPRWTPRSAVSAS